MFYGIIRITKLFPSCGKWGGRNRTGVRQGVVTGGEVMESSVYTGSVEEVKGRPSVEAGDSYYIPRPII